MGATRVRLKFLLRRSTRSAPSIVVEISGPRGVGKSTFADLLRAELIKLHVEHDQLAPVRTPDKTMFWLCGLFWRLHARSIWARWRPVSSEELRLFQRRYWRYRYRSWRFSCSPGIHILDEGVYQLMLMLQAKTSQKDLRFISERLRRLVPFPEVIIFLSASEEAIKYRRLERANARDRLKPEVSTAGREAIRALRRLLEQLPSDQGQVFFVQSLDRSGLELAAEETARMIAARASGLEGSATPTQKT